MNKTKVIVLNANTTQIKVEEEQTEQGKEFPYLGFRDIDTDDNYKAEIRSRLGMIRE